jgi:hypothetical protein
MFQNLVVLKLEERESIVHDIYKEIRHFSEERTFVEVKKRYFYHNRMEIVRKVVRTCKFYYMVKEISRLLFWD